MVSEPEFILPPGTDMTTKTALITGARPVITLRRILPGRGLDTLIARAAGLPRN
ncbi:hypothetical protein GCM10009654_42470 [Streptomyces hebeiensis]|uniref:Uncharacterized protein n=1 Tax=Streptomyces hebeiensis TaxID=229486 RepID=A0ABN1V1C2_9ACTN